MEIRIDVPDAAYRIACEKAAEFDYTIEQALAAFVIRVADDTEFLEDDLNPDGTPRRRTLREQMYRMGTGLRRPHESAQ